MRAGLNSRIVSQGQSHESLNGGPLGTYAIISNANKFYSMLIKLAVNEWVILYNKQMKNMTKGTQTCTVTREFYWIYSQPIMENPSCNC